MKRVLFATALVLILVLSAASIATAQDTDQRPYLGLTFAQHDDGIIVTRVVPDSPADEAGIQSGDVITGVDGEDITFESFADMIGDHQISDTLSLTLLRDQESLDLDVVLGEEPETDVFGLPLPMDAFTFIREGDEELWQIRSLTENHPLYEAGLRSGDAITEFNGEVYSPGQLRSFLSDLADDATVTVTVKRDDEELEMDVPASALETLDRFSLGFSFSDDAGEQIPFNDIFGFEPYDFFGPEDSLFDRLDEMMNRFFGDEGFQFDLPNGLRPEQPSI